MKKMFFRSIFVATVALLVVSSVIVMAQRSKQNTSTRTSARSNAGIYTGVSSTDPENDEGFGIVAVRRTFVMVNGAYDDVKTRKDFVEIELYAAVLPEITDMPDIVQIGDSSFVPSEMPCKDNDHCIKVTITPAEFDQLRDKSLITIYKGRPVNPEVLKELFKAGEPKQVRGAKFGRLDKSKIQ